MYLAHSEFRGSECILRFCSAWATGTRADSKTVLVADTRRTVVRERYALGERERMWGCPGARLWPGAGNRQQPRGGLESAAGTV